MKNARRETAIQRTAWQMRKQKMRTSASSIINMALWVGNLPRKLYSMGMVKIRRESRNLRAITSSKRTWSVPLMLAEVRLEPPCKFAQV